MIGKLSQTPLIIGHRGASATAPENSLAAFRQAIADGADGLEFDVQLAKDGVPVVFHDFTLYRMQRKKLRTSRFTSEELKEVNLGAWFNAKHPRRADHAFESETIPTLAEVFALLEDFRGRIYVELKCRPHEVSALVKATLAEIKKTNLLPQIVIKSFTLEAVSEAKNSLPEIRTAALFAPRIVSFLRQQQQIFKQAKTFLADELSLHYSLAKPQLMKLAAQENLPVTIWTADNPIWVERAVETGIYAIITNDPARFLEEKRLIMQSSQRKAQD
jgi:glycerophosphoryl diester phosphodiesterase